MNNEDSELFDDCTDVLPDCFYVGEKDPFIPEINVDSIIEQLQEDAYEQCGEVADDFLYWDYKDNGKMSDALYELKTRLELDLNSWLLKYGLCPTFCSIKNIEKIDVNDYM